MDEASLDVGTLVDDRFSVEALVGIGGLSEVYRVRHLQLGSLHALKLLTWNRKSLTERLLLEGRIQAQLTHPHIVRVTDVVKLDSRVGLLLEYVEGPSLEEFLEHHGALSVSDALGLFAPVLAAVAHAHDAGVLHRDLKPANVLLVRAPGAWVPKVTDFGLAKVVEEGLGPSTRTGVSMGTPGYMPPEQIRNSASSDVRTDIFALGCLLYEMISGRKAFGAPDGGEIELTATIDRVPEPLDDVSPELWSALARAMERDRDHRFPDARAFADALGIADHPTLAASPDLVRVPLALDPSTYPSGRSGPSTEATLPPSAPTERRTPGPVVVGLVLGAVLASVLLTAIMTQPVLESRRAQRADRPSEGLEARPAPEAVAVPAPVAAPEPVESVEDAGEAAPSAPEPAVDVPTPKPTVIEVRSPPDPDAVELPADLEGAGTGDVSPSSGEAPSDTAEPEPDETPAPPEAAPEVATTAAEPEPGPPFEVLPVGKYEGTADRIPLILQVWDSTGGRVEAEALFLQSGLVTRRERLEGTFDPSTRALRLQSETSSLVFEGQKAGRRLSGEYRRGQGRAQTWQVTLQ